MQILEQLGFRVKSSHEYKFLKLILVQCDSRTTCWTLPIQFAELVDHLAVRNAGEQGHTGMRTMTQMIADVQTDFLLFAFVVLKDCSRKNSMVAFRFFLGVRGQMVFERKGRNTAFCSSRIMQLERRPLRMSRTRGEQRARVVITPEGKVLFSMFSSLVYLCLFRITAFVK